MSGVSALDTALRQICGDLVEQLDAAIPNEESAPSLRWSTLPLTRAEWSHFIPNSVTLALPLSMPFVSYQNAILRMLRLPAPRRSI